MAFPLVANNDGSITLICKPRCKTGSLETKLISICKTMPRAKEILRVENGRPLVMPPICVEVEALFEVDPLFEVETLFEVKALFEVEGIEVRAKISVKMRMRVVKMPKLRLKITIVWKLGLSAPLSIAIM